MRCVDLGVAHVEPVVEQRLDDLAGARWGEAPIGAEAHQQELAARHRKGGAQVAAMCQRRVEVVERAGDQQVGVGVEIVAELVALVAQVAFDLELGLQRAVAESPVAQAAAELLRHRVVAHVGDVADHAGHAQAPFGHRAVGIEVPAVKVGVGHDGAASHLVEGDVLRRQIGRGGHRDAMPQPPRILQRPAQRLHAAQAATHDGGQLLDAQAVEQPGLRIDPVFHRHHRKVGAVGRARLRVGLHRAGRAETRAEVVDADDEEALGVQRLARPDQVVPPAFASGLAGVRARHMVTGVERVAHQHRIALVGIQRAVGFMRQRVVAQHRAAAQPQRLGEMHGLGLNGTD